MATSFNWSRLRDASASLAPDPASASAMAFPRPLLAPVINATLPLSFFSLIHYSSHSDSVRCVDDVLLHRLRRINARKRQAARLPSRLDRKAAHASHPLT